MIQYVIKNNNKRKYNCGKPKTTIKTCVIVTVIKNEITINKILNMHYAM